MVLLYVLSEEQLIQQELYDRKYNRDISNHSIPQNQTSVHDHL